MKYLVTAIFTFYQLNDVVLHRKKINRCFREYKRVVKDQAYSLKQIQQALHTADTRMRMVILLLASTACHIGALPWLILGNLTKLPDLGLYRIVFYDGSSSEYYSFCTRECAQTGIDNYLEYRKRCEEKLSFNEKKNRWEPEVKPLYHYETGITAKASSCMLKLMDGRSAVRSI